LIFQDSVTGQFFCQPVTAAIAALGIELYHEIIRANNVTERLEQEQAISQEKFQQVFVIQVYLNIISADNDRATEIGEVYLRLRENTADIPPPVVDGAQDLPFLDLTAEGTAEAPLDMTIQSTNPFGANVVWTPRNSFVSLAKEVPAKSQTCIVQALLATDQDLQTVENNIVAQPALCAFTAGIRQTPDDTIDGNFKNDEPRRVRRRVIGPESIGHGAPTVFEQQAENILLTVDEIISEVEVGMPI
jgi:hypothetical protein